IKALNNYRRVNSYCDLFRRFAVRHELSWVARELASPSVESLVPEFRDYITRFGTGYVQFMFDKKHGDFYRPLCLCGDLILGLVVAGKVFLIPSPVPRNESQLDQMLYAAIQATLAYRKRMSTQMPVWVNEFAFAREGDLRVQLEEVQQKALELE